MKKLHSLAFYALVTPAIALGAGSALAQQTNDQNAERQQQSTQGYQGSEQSDQQKSADRMKSGDHSGMQTEDYISSVPSEGRQASELMGADVRTADDEDIGSVSDLIIDKDGQVVAVVVGVGGFLGMGEKNVAISWDKVTQTGTSDDQELRVDATRDELTSAPEFEKRD